MGPELLPLILVFVLIGYLVQRKQGNAFQRLGDIRGMPMRDIIARVGRPNSISATADGQLYQWMKTRVWSGYHYAISADANDNAIGFTHQWTK
jgi:hypothetical protein